MANVAFKRGLQASLPTGANIVDGVFYLTTDSNRLYVGEGSGTSAKLKLLNQTVQIVANESALNAIVNPVENDFYYLAAENILAVRHGDGWVQVNPDHDTIVSAVNVSANSTDGLTVSVNPGNGAIKSDSLKLSADGGVQLDYTDGLKITGDTYSIGASANATAGVDITLDSANQADSAFTVIGDGATSVSMDSGKVKISSTDTTLSGGHSAVTLNNGKLSVSVTDGGNNAVTAEESKVINIPYGSTTVNAQLGSKLNVYTIDEVDTLINGLNGMTFKGTVGSEGTLTAGLPTSGVKLGDTYMVAGTLTVSAAISADDESHAGRTGDLLIASGGTEVNGIITSGLEWSFVPSADDTDNTTYSVVLDKANAKFGIKESSGATIGSVAVKEGNAINVEASIDENNPNDLVITVGHDEVDVNTTSAGSASNATSVTAVVGITDDGYGHITGYQTKEFGIKTYELLDATVTATSGVATVSSVLKASDNSTTVSDFQIGSTSLQVGSVANSGKVDIDLVWGTF